MRNFNNISKKASKIVNKGILRGESFSVFTRDIDTDKWVEVDPATLTEEELYYCMVHLDRYKATWCFASCVDILHSFIENEEEEEEEEEEEVNQANYRLKKIRRNISSYQIIHPREVPKGPGKPKGRKSGMLPAKQVERQGNLLKNGRLYTLSPMGQKIAIWMAGGGDLPYYTSKKDWEEAVAAVAS